jgi:actin-related protein
VTGRSCHDDDTKLIGEAACTSYDSHLQLSSPIVNGIIQNWEDMESIWEHMFDTMLVRFAGQAE